MRKMMGHLFDAMDATGNDGAALLALEKARLARAPKQKRSRGRPKDAKSKTLRAERMRKFDEYIIWVMRCFAQDRGIYAPKTLVDLIQDYRPDLQCGASKEADRLRIAGKVRAIGRVGVIGGQAAKVVPMTPGSRR